jgi:siroheme synthase-like protein
VQPEAPAEFCVLPVALPLVGRPVLVIGGGEEAEDKIHKLLACGACVTLVAEQATARLVAQAHARRITWFARRFLPSDVQGAHLVLLTDVDEPLARRLAALRMQARFFLCTLDQPAYTDIHLVSTVMRGPVQIGISTGGRAPLLARKLRKALELGLTAQFAQFAHKFARLRAAYRDMPKAQRSERLERALNGFAMDVRVSYPAEEGQEPDHPAVKP